MSKVGYFSRKVLWDTVPYIVSCQVCQEMGYLKDDQQWLTQCGVCNGVGRDMIPWTELFKCGTEWVLNDFDDDEDGYY